MTWTVAVAGTLHRDDITTPHGRLTTHGGSAVYFAAAAARHAPVLLNGIVGADSIEVYRSMLEPLPVDLAGVEVSSSPTFTWHAVHDFERWVTASELAEPGCDPEWRPRLSPAAGAAQVLFLASMHPRLQASVLEQSSARLVGSDSMTVFMDEDAGAVRAVAEASDVLFLNRRELAVLTGESRWRHAAASLVGAGRLRAVVVKGGPDGAGLATARGLLELPAAPAARVIDPTGAGDALAGGFLGHCAAREADDDETFAAALAVGVRAAAGAITAFGVRDLLRAGGWSRPRDV